MVKPKIDFWSILRNFIYRITWNPESNCTCRLKNPFPTPLKYIDITRTTGTTLVCESEKQFWRLMERWWERIVGCMDRFHNRKMSEKPPDGYTLSGRDLTRKQTTSRPTIMARSWKHVWCIKRKEKQNGLLRSQSAIMPEDYVVSTSLILKARKLRISWRMLQESWKFDCSSNAL